MIVPQIPDIKPTIFKFLNIKDYLLKILPDCKFFESMHCIHFLIFVPPRCFLVDTQC